MGYTHYYYTKPELDKELFEKIAIDFKKMVPVLNHLGIKLGDGLGENTPIIRPDEITFNGLTNCGHQKQHIGLAWPSDTAQGVKPDHVFTELCELSKGSWCAGPTLETRVCGGDCSYETFSIMQKLTQEQITNGENGFYFNCTKTNYKPYDLAVNVCLVIAKHYLTNQIIVNSDGNMNNWVESIELCKHFLGYGSDFKLNEDREELKKQEKPKEDLKVDKTKINVNDIFYASWGYEQTNIDFYKVLSISPTKKTCKIIRVHSKTIEQIDYYLAPRVEA